MEINMNVHQREAAAGHNLLLLGTAGTGKSFTLSKIQEHLISAGKHVKTVCSTGIACDNFRDAYQRLLSKVKEDQCGSVNVNELHSSFEFETLEIGNNLKVPKLVFIGHILKVFPGARKERKTGNTTSKVTSYHGISLLPIEPIKPIKPIKVEDIKKYVGNVENATIVKELKDSVKCSLDSYCTSNGNRILKFITLYVNGDWTLEVSGINIDMERIYVSNKFYCDQHGIDLVFSAVNKITLCVGVALTHNVIMTRYHLLDNWQSENVNGKRLRSVMCSRVIQLNSKGTTCIKCQKMTFQTSNSKKSEKENLSNSPISTSNPTDIKTPKPVLSKEIITDMIPGATDEMIELILNQAQNAIRDPRGRRWTQGMISVCLQWFCRSPHSYEAFRETKYLVLPSRSTLIQYKSRVKHEVGFDDGLLLWMLEEAKRKEIPIEGYTGGLILDEMSIQSDIQICKNGDLIELSGFMDVGEEGNSSAVIRKGKNEKVLGTHALQLVFLGVTGFRFPVAHFISDGIQAYGLYPLFWEAVDRLRMFGFSVAYTCMDGAQSNRSFMHITIDNRSLFIIQCPCNFSSMIFMMDSKHVIKKIRNNIIKSGQFKSSTRLLTLDTSQTIQWQMFIDCYKLDKGNALQLNSKLTNEHLYPSNQEKMRNHLAEDILDSEMLNLMVQYQKYLGEKGCVLNGTIELLKRTSIMINIFKDMRPVKTYDDTRLQELCLVAQWFDNWKSSALNNSFVNAKREENKYCHYSAMKTFSRVLLDLFNCAKHF